MSFKLKPDTIYRIISKDKYNNNYFWVEDLYYVNDDETNEIEEFHLFMHNYLDSNISVNIENDEFIIWGDLLYIKDKSDPLNIVKKLQNQEWILYEIPELEIGKLKEIEKQFTNNNVR